MFQSNHGSVGERMRSLNIRDSLISKAMADPDQAMAAADPSTTPGAGLANTQPVQDEAMAGAAAQPIEPAKGMGGMFFDEIQNTVGMLDTQLGGLGPIEAQWLSAGISAEQTAQFRAAVNLIREHMEQMNAAIAVARQANPTLQQYDRPIQAPKIEAALPPMDGMADPGGSPDGANLSQLMGQLGQGMTTGGDYL